MAFVTFIHGIGNKPEQEKLRRIWIDALREGDGGFDLPTEGIETQMVYWADLLYPPAVSQDESTESAALDASTEEGLAAATDVEPDWLTTMSPEERAFVEAIALEVKAKAELVELQQPRIEERPGLAPDEVVLERIPLPWFIKEPLMRALLRDVHHYLFNVELVSPRDGKRNRIRDVIRDRFVAALRAVPEAKRPHVVVSHSMGTVIAYDCLKRVDRCPEVDGLMTIGSPLGLDEIQDKLRPEWSRSNGFPSATVSGSWINVYDRLDPVVGFDPQFANDYGRGGERVVRDVNEQNWGRWRHDITKYLAGKRLRTGLREMLVRRGEPRDESHHESLGGGDGAEDIVDRLARGVAAYDRAATRAAAGELVEHARTSDTIDEREAKRAMNALRRNREFELMLRVGDALLQAGQAAPSVRRLYAQALIDTGALTAATSVLQGLVADAGGNRREENEARGLLGRAHKQAYVDGHARSRGRAADLMRSALTHYFTVYDENPAELWHGINGVALLARAARDGVRVDGFPDARTTAGAILGNVERLDEEGRANPWDLATAAEACVALDRCEDALRWMQRYVDDPSTGAFEIGSTLRQLREVWQLAPAESGECGALVLLLQSHLLRKSDGGSVEIRERSPLDAFDARADFLQRVLGDDKYQTLEWYRRGLAASAAVARIGHERSRGIGTGFLVRAKRLDPALGDGWLLVTNAHVISPTYKKALRPAEAVVTFESLDGGQKEYRVRELLWTSPPEELDASIVALDETVPGVPELEVAEALPALDPPSRLYLIGHPHGGTLSFSIDDNLLIDHEDPVVHYRCPTDPGSSGSPVFNRNWRLIALHHAGDLSMKRLNGKPGRYPANEGIYLGSIAAAFRRRADA